MIHIAWTIAKAGGWGRSALLAGCTAAVSGLLLVAVSLVYLQHADGQQFVSFVSDGGTRGGVVFAVLLLTLPPLLLLDQVVRLGSAHRDRRLAALRLAGATPSEVRRLGAIEVGIPTSIGALCGVGVFWVLRAVLGADSYGGRGNYVVVGVGGYTDSRFAIIPTSGAPYWWQMTIVVLAVAIAGTFVGWWASRAVMVSPLGVTRRQTKRAPRPWGLALLALAVMLVPVAFSNDHGTDFVAFVIIALIVAALVVLAPWVAHVMARRTASQTDRATSLLAAQRIIAEPGAAGRAAAAIGGISLVGGGVVSFALDVRGSDDTSYMAGVTLVAISLLIGLFIAAGSMAVHSVESLLDRRRELAFLAASGMTDEELEHAAKREITMVALPLAVAGSALGALPLSLGSEHMVGAVLMSLVLGVGITVALVWLAAVLAVRAVRPWARRAASPLNLRTE